MSSAIEVLKGFIICSDELIQKDKFSESGYKEMLETLNKALLALEDRTNAKQELEKILKELNELWVYDKAWNDYFYEGDTNDIKDIKNSIEKRLRELKEMK